MMALLHLDPHGSWVHNIHSIEGMLGHYLQGMVQTKIAEVAYTSLGIGSIDLDVFKVYEEDNNENLFDYVNSLESLSPKQKLAVFQLALDP
jgi:hypothetical protein